MIVEQRRIEPWKTDDRELKAGLEMQAARRGAGLTEGQVAALLGIERHQYLSWERGEESCPPTRRRQITDILEGVQAGTITPPIMNPMEV